MVVLSGRIEDPTIQRTVTQGAKRKPGPRGHWGWRVTWLIIVALMIGAGVYGYMRFAAYGQAKVLELLQQGQQDEAQLKFSAALRDYTEAEALGPVAKQGAAQAAYRAAALYERKSNHTKGQEELRSAEKLDDSVPDYPTALGRSLLLTRSLDEADHAFDRALKVDSNSPHAADTLVGKARVALARQNRDAAESAINDALTKRADHVEAKLLKAALVIHDDPKASSALLEAVQGSDNKGFVATASALKTIADQIQNNLDNPSYERVLVGAALIEHNELDLALLELTDATERNSKFRDAWVNRAQVEVLLGNPDAAQQSIDKAIEIDPTFGFSRYVVGQIAEKRGNKDDAKKAYELALEQRYQEPQVYIALANLEVELNQRDKAIALLQQALDDKIESHELYDTLFWLYIDDRSYKNAVTVATQYVTFDARGTTAQGLLAYAQLLNKQNDLAKTTAQELLTRDPLSAIASLTLGILNNDKVFLQKAKDLDVGGRVTEIADEKLKSAE